ncbi:MAG: hypothetical protein ABL865_06875 [Candidatus Nitrotoga sp.]
MKKRMKDGTRVDWRKLARAEYWVCVSRYIVSYEADGLDGLIDRRLEQTSSRQALADEVMAMTDEYRCRYMGWNVKHFHSWYQRTGGTRSYTWVKKHLQKADLIFEASMEYRLCAIIARYF